MQSGTKRREHLLAAVTVVGTLVLGLGSAEIVLRFLPVPTGLGATAVTAENPVFHFAPNRDYVFSRDWNFSLVNRGHINNVGFVNDQDYRKDGKGPLIAVVGDSYVEAAMVPYGETVHGRLAKALDGEVRVYSFAASGAALSQYLIWARHAVSAYRASAVVINVVGNDFDESLAAYKAAPGFWSYVSNADGTLNLRLSEFRPPARSLFMWSALARYLIFNLKTNHIWFKLQSLVAVKATEYAGNTSVDVGSNRVSDSLSAIDAFFRDLADLVRLPPSRVTFTLDGFRYPADASAGAGTYFDLMRRAFRAKAEALGYEVLDLDPLFFSRHRRTGERFDYAGDGDGHWNPSGHEVAFTAVMSSRLLKQFER